MANRQDKRGRTKNSEPFVRLPLYMLKSAAWQSLKGTPRALYIEIARRYNGKNNGEIIYSVREAGKDIGVSPNTAGRGFKDLEDRGFIKKMRDSSFTLKTKEACEWALTLEPIGNELATKEFVRWTAK